MNILKGKSIYIIILISFILLFEVVYQTFAAEEKTLSKEFVEYVEKNKN